MTRQGENARTVADTYGEQTLAALVDLLSFAEEMRDLIVREGQDNFFGDRLLQLAAEALLQKIGEAANRLPEQFRADHPHIPWRSIRGMRNVVAHQYHAVDHRIVWQTLTGPLPQVMADVRLILAP